MDTARQAANDFHRRDAETQRTRSSPQRHGDTEKARKGAEEFVGIASSRGRGSRGHGVGRLRAALRGPGKSSRRTKISKNSSAGRQAAIEFSPQRRGDAENTQFTTEARRHRENRGKGADEFVGIASSRGRGSRGHGVGRLRAALRGLGKSSRRTKILGNIGVQGGKPQTDFHRRDAETQRTQSSPQRHGDTEKTQEGR